ncbi:MAG: HNH endonuclease [Gaiellales bacterium]|nr:MAG: HNH endonuclease [Gaiellales bacterium]
MTEDGLGIDEAELKRERAKARALRKTQWWRSRLAKGVCYYCGAKASAAELTMDHIVPLVRGGKSVKSNLVPCCKDCNTKKKTLLPLEWEEYMESLEQG